MPGSRSLVVLPMAGPLCFHRSGGDLERLRRLAAALEGRSEDVINRWTAHLACAAGGLGMAPPAVRRAAEVELAETLARIGAADLEGLAGRFLEWAADAAARRVPFPEASRRVHLLEAAVVETLRAAGVGPAEVLDLYLALAHLGHERLILLAETYRRHGERAAAEHAAAIEAEMARLKRDVAGRDRLCGLVGRSLVMQRLYERIALAARSRDAVLLAGESGTGKELAARAIHALSGDPAERFVAVNCAALPRELMESELFGHTRGAFSGARGDHPGVFRAASGGTLFLDEVTELAPEAQAKLLRALQERAVRPVGALAEVPVAVRVVASTNRDLREALEAGRLRRDLYYRLQQLVLTLPPLRERREDIPLLVQHFLARAAADGAGPPKHAATAEALRLLARYDWPGNVRELENAVRAAARIGRGTLLEAADLPAEIIAGAAESAAARAEEAAPDPLAAGFRSQAPPLTIREAERAAIDRAMRAAGGNKTRAASLLQISRKQLYVKLREYGLDLLPVARDAPRERSSST